MLNAHPYPGVVVDRLWNVVSANEPALLLTVGLPAELLGPQMNIYRLSLHPDGLASRTTNFIDWAGHLLDQLRRAVALTGDPTLEALLAEVSAYPNVARLKPPNSGGFDDPPLLMPFRMATPVGEISMFTTLTTFGTPLDVTLDELIVELFFPADDDSERRLRDLMAAAVVAM